MPSMMHMLALVWACLALAGNGRQIELSTEHLESSPFTDSQAIEASLGSQSLAMLLLALNPAVAFNSPGASFAGSSTWNTARTRELTMQGFGAPVDQPDPRPKSKRAGKNQPTAPITPVPEQRVKSEAEIKAGKAFDAFKEVGTPEYEVSVRELPEGEEPSKWYPVGGLAVPRTGSLDKALTAAIFENEDELLKGAYRRYPFLKSSKNKLEYGFRLAEFPDDPVTIADKTVLEDKGNFFTRWFDNLDNPFNDGSGPFNPAAKK